MSVHAKSSHTEKKRLCFLQTNIYMYLLYTHPQTTQTLPVEVILDTLTLTPFTLFVFSALKAILLNTITMIII